MISRILIALCLLVCGTSYCQVEWGTRCGLNFANIVDKGTSDASLNQSNEKITTLGLHLGLLATIRINEKLGFQPEIQFSQKGYRTRQSGVNYHLNYFEAPLIASVNITEWFNVEFGPTPSFLISRSYFDSFDIGLLSGLKVDITDKLGINARYNHGLKAIANIQLQDANNNKIGEYKEYNRCFYLGVTYKFGSK